MCQLLSPSTCKAPAAASRGLLCLQLLLLLPPVLTVSYTYCMYETYVYGSINLLVIYTVQRRRTCTA